MKIFSMTDVGRKREINQDYVFATALFGGRFGTVGGIE